MERLEEIRERCEKATPGPWEMDNEHRWLDIINANKPDIRIATAANHPDWVFIAHAREDIPFLLGEIERLTAERDAAVRDIREILKCEDIANTCKFCARHPCRTLPECDPEWRGVEGKEGARAD